MKNYQGFIAKRVKEVRNLAYNEQEHICGLCRRCNGLSEKDTYICKYNKDNKGIKTGLTTIEDNLHNYKCKYFKRNYKYNTIRFKSKKYSSESNGKKLNFNYVKGKYKIKGLDNFYTEFDGYYKGYRYVIIFQKIGHRCGYVEVPDKISNYINDIDCHGGITYYDYNNHSYPVKHNNGYWIGFDTAHCGDSLDIKQAKDYNLISEESYYFTKHINDKYPIKEEVRPFEYVENECKNIIEQVIKLEY